MRSLGVVVLGCVLLTACGQEDPFAEGPELGPSPGEVRLSFDAEANPGETVTLDVEVTADRSLTGASCLDFYRWQPGYGPEIDWHVDLDSGAASSDLEARPPCPTDAVELPTNLSFVLPPLANGVYNLTYYWSDADGGEGDSASLAFEVGAA